MPFERVLLLAGVYGFAGFAQGLTGFAFAMISVPVIALLYSPVSAVGINVVIGSCLMIYNFYLHRKEIQYRKLAPLVVLSVGLVPAGAVFLRSMPEDIVMLTLGVFIIALTVLSAAAVGRVSRVLAFRGTGYGFAALAGFLGGAFTTPGPPIVAYLYNSDENRMRAKADTQLLVAAVSLAMLVTHALMGTVTGERALIALPFVPVAFLGARLGVHLSRRLPTGVFRGLTDVLLIVLGLYIIATNL